MAVSSQRRLWVVFCLTAFGKLRRDSCHPHQAVAIAANEPATAIPDQIGRDGGFRPTCGHSLTAYAERMKSLSELIPELALWNNGKGIAPSDWIWIEGRADHALGFASLLWPEFVEFEDYVLRKPLDVTRLRGWEAGGHTRQQVETAMNAFLLDDVFPQDQSDPALKDEQCERFAEIMSDMLGAKLARDFPERRFAAFTLDGDDFGVSFHQT